jgi:hypothetical protein
MVNFRRRKCFGNLLVSVVRDLGSGQRLKFDNGEYTSPHGRFYQSVTTSL